MSALQTLGSIAGHHPILEFECAHCPMHGYVNTARLIAEHSADLPLFVLGRELCHDCPRHDAALHERCDLHFPQIPNL